MMMMLVLRLFHASRAVPYFLSSLQFPTLCSTLLPLLTSNFLISFVSSLLFPFLIPILTCISYSLISRVKTPHFYSLLFFLSSLLLPSLLPLLTSNSFSSSSPQCFVLFSALDTSSISLLPLFAFVSQRFNSFPNASSSLFIFSLILFIFFKFIFFLFTCHLVRRCFSSSAIRSPSLLFFNVLPFCSFFSTSFLSNS
uniref:Uncharacterized protein n=1 Tax=Cacopsylla melanoneura TaxID=428564 RepID=A0A8D8QMT6_9HEMI